ncbi:Serine/threonine-protein phosphatase 5 [Nymphaea thermarum]|nr:Serine/threonine-protein phosphatase 5 [Nymphaea thermarum]
MRNVNGGILVIGFPRSPRRRSSRDSRLLVRVVRAEQNPDKQRGKNPPTPPKITKKLLQPDEGQSEEEALRRRRKKRRLRQQVNLQKEGIAHKFAHAVELYTQAIELNPDNAGYYRRGAAYLSMGKFKEALKDFQQVKRIRPNDPDATKKLKECEKAVMKLKFEEAIAVKDHERRSVAEPIDYHSIVVGSEYTGARIEGDVVTLDFIKKMMDDFKNQKSLHKRYAFQIVLQAREMLRALPTLVDITVPDGHHFTVCGDVHGQFYDLLNIFELNGLPSDENPYLFNGDFVDRGSFSVEIILTLFAFKCMSPSAIHLARGNHESKSMNKIYGFEGEVKSKLNDTFVELFAEAFCCLPLAHVINEKIFVVHGGLFSVDGVKLSDIRAIDRFCEPPEEGLMCELLWSDPQPNLGRGPSKRGVGLSFGADVTKRFLQENGLELVVRSHEVKDEGYEVEHDGKLITVFSAPNYCDQMANKGAFLKFKAPEMKPEAISFSAVSQKYKSGDIPIMGNIMEACVQRKEEAKAEAAGKPEKAEPNQGLDFVGGCEEADEGDGGGGSCGDTKEGRVRVKVVLRKQELEWLLMHCREDGGKALEELLMGIHHSRKGLNQYQNHHDRGWRPALDSIMEIPELQTVES